ncbi:MAG: Lrp/AsnC family transcriptional regulator [Actinobacteria bacterium HGW-Actinobacteria-1]|nr:MAG: Lrp/AsnC family transcriptional regulator [Actinobacteria bacterium HGW-Actinobacteria-1]
MVDAIDLTIVGILARDARTTFSDIAEQVGLSGPSTADRVRRLEERGVIRGYHAQISPDALGLDLTAFVEVTLDAPKHRDVFLAAVANEPHIVECHHIAGDHDYLLKVRCAGTAGLESFVSDVVKAIAGVVRTRTTIVLSSAFERALSLEV